MLVCEEQLCFHSLGCTRFKECISRRAQRVSNNAIFPYAVSKGITFHSDRITRIAQIACLPGSDSMVDLRKEDRISLKCIPEKKMLRHRLHLLIGTS